MRKYDVVIVGAGGTGLSAGMYSGRLGMKVLVLGKSSGSELSIGGTITTTDSVENYPGFISLSGVDLTKRLEEHARKYGIEIIEERVTKIEKNGKGFSVTTDLNSYEAGAIIYATGTSLRRLDIPGEKEFASRGVSYCALCDGPLFRGKAVAVVGGSDAAVKEALYLAEHAKKVYIIYRKDQLRAEQVNLKRMSGNKKIEVIYNTNLKEIKGDEFVDSVVLDRNYKGKNTLHVDGVFVAVGHVPLSDLAKSLGAELNEKGEVITDKESRTNVPGLFAAGDVTDSDFKQIITGVAEGVRAAYHAFKYVKSG